jgi:hypothetical protein
MGGRYTSYAAQRLVACGFPFASRRRVAPPAKMDHLTPLVPRQGACGGRRRDFRACPIAPSAQKARPTSPSEGRRPAADAAYLDARALRLSR